jgi:hypothetical protein
MPTVPTPREFGRLLRRMDLPARAHLSDLARKVELGKDPAEAALVAAAARRGLRTRWWIVGMQVLLIPLVILNSVGLGSPWNWLTVATLLPIAFNIPVTIFRHTRSLQRAERVNRKFAGADEA